MQSQKQDAHLQSQDAHLPQGSDSEVVYLDLSPIDPERIQYRFPNIIRVCKHWGIDLFNQPIPVSPAAHYWMGGITADLNSETTLKNLYAVGENASTGVHGANRLASNSLLECLVYGAQLKTLALPEGIAHVESIPQLDPDLSDDWLVQVAAWRDALPQLIWNNAGISRDQERMDRAIAQVNTWQQQFNQLSISKALMLSPGETLTLPSDVTADNVRLWGEVGNLFTIAALILKSAAFRTESRGGHYRSDYPTAHSDWLAHTLITADKCWMSAKLQNAV